MASVSSVEILGGGPSGMYSAILLRHLMPRVRVRATEQNPRGATFGFGVVFSDQALHMRPDEIIGLGIIGGYRSASSLRQRVSLPARALRNRFAHSEVHLDVEWRDLSDGQWNASVQDRNGLPIAIRETPWRRAAAIWLRAVDLGAGGRFTDMPLEPVDSLIQAVAIRKSQNTSCTFSFTDRRKWVTISNDAELRAQDRGHHRRKQSGHLSRSVSDEVIAGRTIGDGRSDDVSAVSVNMSPTLLAAASPGSSAARSDALLTLDPGYPFKEVRSRIGGASIRAAPHLGHGLCVL